MNPSIRYILLHYSETFSHFKDCLEDKQASKQTNMSLLAVRLALLWKGECF